MKSSNFYYCGMPQEARGGWLRPGKRRKAVSTARMFYGGVVRECLPLIEPLPPKVDLVLSQVTLNEGAPAGRKVVLRCSAGGEGEERIIARLRVGHCENVSFDAVHGRPGLIFSNVDQVNFRVTAPGKKTVAAEVHLSGHWEPHMSFRPEILGNLGGEDVADAETDPEDGGTAD